MESRCNMLDDEESPWGDELALDEMLALLDAYDALSASCSEQPPPKEPAKLKRRSPTSNSAAVRKSQRKKQAELAELRRIVPLLEQQLTQLRGQKKGRKGGEGVWHELAEHERTRRQHAEEQNERFKRLLRSCEQIYGTLGTVLHAGALLRHEVEQEQKAAPLYSDPRRVFSMDYALAALELKVKELHVVAPSVMSSEALWPCTGRPWDRMQRNVDSITGEYVDIALVETLSMPLETATELMWKFMTTQKAENRQHIVQERSCGEESANKKYAVVLPLQNSVLRLNGVSFSRKFVETDSTLLVYSSLLTTAATSAPLGASLTFSEASWIQLVRSPTQPYSSCCLKLCYRLQAESPVPQVIVNASVDRNSQAIASSVLQSIGGAIYAESKKVHDISLTVAPEENTS